MQIKGLHHVSALTAHADQNYRFYTNIMGLRLIKKRSTKTTCPSTISSMAMKKAIRVPNLPSSRFRWPDRLVKG